MSPQHRQLPHPASPVTPRPLHLQRRCACGAASGLSGSCPDCQRKKALGLQTRLRVGAADDAYEREAEQVARQVVATPALSAAPQIQRRGEASMDEPIQAPPSVDASLAAPGQALAPALRQDMEQRLGHDFSHVRVHADAAADRSARELGAQAYTVGHDIAFAAGQYAPDTAAGRHLLAHELVHVVQQAGGSTGAVQRQPRRGAGAGGATAAQQRMIDDARRAAAVRTQIASFRARGLEGAQWLHEATTLARIKFDWDRPNMEQIGDILASMGAGLVNVPVQVAPAGDTNCSNRAGYVVGLRPPIVLCPAFFRSSEEQRIRTMVHEMAHARGIGTADGSETYYMVFDCTSPGAFEAADAWSNYVHCLSGQPADEPDRDPDRAGRKGTKP